MEKRNDLKKGNPKNDIPFFVISARGVTLGILTGLLEIVIYILFYYKGDHLAFPLIVSSITLTALMTTILFIFLWFIVHHLTKLNDHHLSIALAIGLFLLMMGFFITDTFRFSTLTQGHLFLIIGLTLISLLIAVIVYILCQKGFFKSIQNQPLLTFSLKTLLAGLILFFFFWLVRFHSPGSVFMIILSAIATGILFFIILFFIRKIHSLKVITIIICSLFFILLFQTVLDYLNYQRNDLKSNMVEYRDHQVKRVFLLTVDTLRPDFLTCYNPDAEPTPHMDQIKKDGILFKNAISTSPWTLPSFVSIMTGLPSKYHNVLGKYHIVPDTLSTLAEYMEKEGYVTGGITNNPYLTEYYQMDQGFKTFRSYPKNFISQAFGFKILKKMMPDRFLYKPTTEDLSNLTIKWFDRNHNQDFFFWLHILDPHMPYTPPEKYLKDKNILGSIGKGFWNFKEIRSGTLVLTEDEKEWVRTLYNAEIHYVDDQIGRILEKMKTLDIYDETLIVFVSDHGEEFWEHGGFEHGHTLYNEQLHVPLMIKLPLTKNNEIQKGVINDIVGTNHVMGTILDLCGLQSRDEKSELTSLRKYWNTISKKPNHQTVFGAGLLYGDAKESVIFNQNKYIQNIETDAMELYDLAQDPQEKKSLTRTNPKLTKKGESLVISHQQKALEKQSQLGIQNKQKIELSEEAEKQLKSLGYIF